MRRRVLIPLLLAALSALYWLWVWLTVQAHLEGVPPDTVEGLFVTIQANGAVYQATWAYVAGVGGVHGLLAVLGAARRDRDVLVGTGISAALHLAFLLATGILAS